jgi:hypothetical protein
MTLNPEALNDQFRGGAWTNELKSRANERVQILQKSQTLNA